MSKTFETNALKGKSLAAGMKRRIAELGKYGVKEADLTVMEQDADKAIEMIREVDRLREEVTRKLQEANEQLNSLRDRAAYSQFMGKICFRDGRIYSNDLYEPILYSYDTLSASRRHFGKELPNHQLQTVAAACGYDLTNHHHALADAEACAYIAMKLL